MTGKATRDATSARQETGWSPRVDPSAGPLYLVIADAIAADIRSGRLAPGARLPPQRVLARMLDIDFTTVSRAYTEARHRGLVDGKVGQGTYVRAPAPPSSAPRPAPIAAPLDMSMNMPPRLDDPALAGRLWDGVAALREAGGLDLLMRYQAPGGSAADRMAGAAWLAPRLPGIGAERVVLCAGAQGGLSAVLSTLAGPGDTVCAEALTYPGFLSLAAHARLKVTALPMDALGLIPDAFERACREGRPRALYCNPTLNNPTTTTLPLDRREALVRIARRHAVPIIEDDANGALPAAAPPPLAALAPDIVYHIATLSKCLSPALRIAYLVVPQGMGSARLIAAIRAISTLPSPLGAAIATRWISDGVADAHLAALRGENAARTAIACQALPPALVQASPDAFHLWLRLPTPWTRADLVLRLRGGGVSVVPADAFTPSGTAPPEAVRLGLGVPATRDELRDAVHLLADLLAFPPDPSALIV